MSTCISRHGEYSEHEFDAGEYACRLCGAEPVDRIVAEVRVQEREAVLDEVERDLRWAYDHNPNASIDFAAGLGVGIHAINSLRDGA